MNRYKIILESESFLANDEFEELVKINMLHQSPSFNLVEAINLEGRVENPGSYQFYCTTHKFGWNIDEDGQNLGCFECNIFNS